MIRKIRASHRRTSSAAARTELESLESRTLMSAAINSAIALGSNSTIGDAVASVVKDSSGNTYMYGTFGGSFDANPAAGITTLTSNGSEDLFIIAYSSAGTLLWAKSIGGAGHDYAGGMTIDSSGNLFITARFQNSLDADPNGGTATLTSNGGYDVLVASLNSSGTLTWAKSFGGTDNEFPTALAADSTGSLYVGGSFSGTVDMDPGAGTLSLTANTTSNADTFISKFDSTGGLVRVLQMPHDDDMTLSGLAVDTSDNLFALGIVRGNAVFPLGGSGTLAISSPSGHYEAYLAKYTSAGSLTYLKTYGDSQSAGFDAIQTGDLTTDSDGNILITGTFGGTVDFDPGSAVHTLSESQSPDDFSGYLLKLDNDGNYLFSGAFVGDSWSHLYSVRTDASNNIYVGGDFNGTIDFNLGAGTSNQTGNSTFNTAFVAKYTSTGGLLWVQRASGGGNLSRVLTLAVGPGGTLAAGGEFYTSIAFDTASGTQAFNSANFNDLFLLELSQTTSPTTLTLSPSNASRIVGQSVTLTATLTTSVGTPTGTIAFFKDGVFFNSAAINGSGQASVSLTVSATGTLQFTAVYAGDSNYAGSTASAVSVPVAANRAPIGSVDSASLVAISGWTADLDNPTTALSFQVKIDGATARTVTAGNTRNDLLSLVGGTNHGFRFQLPAMAAGTHTITLFAVDPISGQSVQFATTTVTSNSLYFDEAWYRAAYPDIAAAINSGAVSSGWQHFSLYGQQEGRNPSAYFNEMWYRTKYADIGAAVANHTLASGFAHFVAAGAHEGRDPSVLFSEAYYRRANADVASAVTSGALASGFQHFLLTGLQEGRAAIPWFSASNYLGRYADIAAAITAGTVRTAFDHFVGAGMTEGRRPSNWYLESFYLATYPAIATAVSNHSFASGLVHFINYGMNEGRVSDPTFDSAWYLSQYADAVTAIGNNTVKSAFQHYLLYGRLLGHAAHA